ncbi:MAG: hypothetical protein P4K86_08045 [Terracidiphilus sp.]|nr:hypothetical protein [Terracidiphilus sp.]MDR3777235.1 hypothetical protein [Terracidiphilus sp.]
MPKPRRLFPILLPVLSFVLIVSFASSACALGPKADAYVGYSRVGADAFYPNVGGLNGWQAALHVKMKPFLGGEADVAQYGLGASSTIPKTTTVMVGPRITVGTLGVKAFVHGLAGFEHSANSSGLSISGSSFSYALGGGFDLPLLPFFAWRVSGDYLSAPTLSPGSGTHARFGTGIVFRF